MLKTIVDSLKRVVRKVKGPSRREEINSLYRLLYQLTHNLESSLDLTAGQTEEAFATQLSELPSSLYLLSDPWFKDNVDRILSEEEIQVKREWFRGKEILDAGCGNGRWSYGLAKLGAHVTAVDVNQIAIDETCQALSVFPVNKAFYRSPLEELSKNLPAKKYDLVFCWGVLHHCRSFNKAFQEVSSQVKEGGLIYLYLYGRESLGFKQDLELFKERLKYNTLFSAEERLDFLRKKAKGDENLIHILHDEYAPLINRRLNYEHVKGMLEAAGFQGVVRTVDSSEIMVRAVKGDPSLYQDWVLPKKKAPYWFKHHSA